MKCSMPGASELQGKKRRNGLEKSFPAGVLQDLRSCAIRRKALLRIAVIDGQGGGIGGAIIKKIKEVYGEQVEVWALGTNAIATAQMMKAGANRGASGENAVCVCVRRVDVVAGPVSILMAQSMMGEVTPSMARAVGEAEAVKLLLPLSQESIAIVGAVREPLPHLVEKLVCDHLSAFVHRKESR